MIGGVEKIVCSIELARQLKALGIPQDSALYWCEYWGPMNAHSTKIKEVPNDPGAPSAFTADELHQFIEKSHSIERNLVNWELIIFDEEGAHQYYRVKRSQYPTLADAYAKCILMLKNEEEN